MSIILSYIDETGRNINIALEDWDAVERCAHSLSNAPIHLDVVEYFDGNNVGIFNLHTFSVC